MVSIKCPSNSVRLLDRQETPPCHWGRMTSVSLRFLPLVFLDFCVICEPFSCLGIAFWSSRIFKHRYCPLTNMSEMINPESLNFTPGFWPLDPAARNYISSPPKQTNSSNPISCTRPSSPIYSERLITIPSSSRRVWPRCVPRKMFGTFASHCVLCPWHCSQQQYNK